MGFNSGFKGLKDVEVRFLLWNGIFNVIYRRNQKFCDC